MARSLIGPRIRDRRRSMGVTQASVAARVGISASYLNLIEGNKRNIGGALLRRIADELGLGIDEVDGAIERRLLADLGELAGEPLLADLQLDASQASELAGRHGPWGRALIKLHRALLDRDRAVNALSDRLSQDPYLGDAVHRMLTQVAAIRSSAEILETVDDLGPARRARFVAVVGAESRRLAEVAQGLAAFFDKSRASTRSITPVEEVDDFLLDRGNHFPSLEAAGARLRAAIGGECREDEVAAWLAREPAAAVPAASGDPATRRFLLVRAAAGRFELGGPIDAEMRGCALLTSDAARLRARRVLASYVAAAVLMPYEEYLATAVATRYDVERLAARFGASYEQACHRLVTLRRPGAEAIAFGLMRVDAAGFVTKRFPLPRLPLPRHGNGCPLWPVYQAFQSPGSTVRQLAAFPSGERFLLVARTIEKPRPAYAMPRRMFSIMLACDALHADRTVYGDGLDLGSNAPAVPVGPNCRVCVRLDCAYREEDPIIDAAVAAAVLDNDDEPRSGRGGGAG